MRLERNERRKKFVQYHIRPLAQRKPDKAENCDKSVPTLALAVRLKTLVTIVPIIVDCL